MKEQIDELQHQVAIQQHKILQLEGGIRYLSELIHTITSHLGLDEDNYMHLDHYTARITSEALQGNMEIDANQES